MSLKTVFAIVPAVGIIASNVCNKVDIVKCGAGVDQKVLMERVLRPALPQWHCPGMHSAIHLPIT